MNFSKADINQKGSFTEKLHGTGTFLLKFPNVLEGEDFEVDLDSMVKTIGTHTKKPQEKLIVFLNIFVGTE